MKTGVFKKIVFFFVLFHLFIDLSGQLTLKMDTLSKPNYKFYFEDDQGNKSVDSSIIAGVKSLSYSYLWIFSDGSFEKKPSGRTTHTFDEPGLYSTHVYSVEIYNNTAWPPRYIEKSDYFFSEISSEKIGQTNDMVVSGNYIDLDWFENELCYQDGLRVGIISFRRNESTFNEEIKGVIKLYYNGEIRNNGVVVENMSPTLLHSKTLNFDVVNSEAHNKGTRVINGHTYRDSLVWYADFIQKEKHLFVEFSTEEVLSKYVSEEGKSYTTPFLLVFESSMPEALNNRTNRAINLGFDSNVVDAKFINAKIEGDHDPNFLTISALEKAEDDSYWMQGEVSFSNDATGMSMVKKLKVNIDLPDTYESIEWLPSGCSENLKEIEYDGKGSWHVNRAAITSIDDTLRKAWHVGWLKFRLKSKPGVAIEDLKPVKACITFGQHPTECTEKIQPNTLEVKILAKKSETSRNEKVFLH